MKVETKEKASIPVAQQRIPSLSVPPNASVKLAADDKDQSATTEGDGAVVKLSTIVEARKQWETNAYRTSNQQLYGVLTQCYSFYRAMGKNTKEAKAMRADLKSFLASHAIKCKASTHGIAKVVKCVFFDGAQSVDRRRISTYSLVLACALENKVAAPDLASFIETNGGVEEIRRFKAKKSLSRSNRADRARFLIETATPMTSLRIDVLSQSIDASEYGQPLLAIVVKRADGQIDIHGVIKNKVAVNAALATLLPRRDGSSTTDLSH